LNETDIALLRKYGMTANCNHCSRPVREGKKYCDPFCTYAQIEKNQAGKESGNDTRN
jgi:hypothetical protein